MDGRRPQVKPQVEERVGLLVVSWLIANALGRDPPSQAGVGRSRRSDGPVGAPLSGAAASSFASVRHPAPGFSTSWIPGPVGRGGRARPAMARGADRRDADRRPGPRPPPVISVGRTSAWSWPERPVIAGVAQVQPVALNRHELHCGHHSSLPCRRAGRALLSARLVPKQGAPPCPRERSSSRARGNHRKWSSVGEVTLQNH